MPRHSPIFLQLIHVQKKSQARLGTAPPRFED
jgi:hypothetical protein